MSLARAFISGTVVGEPEKRRTPNDYTVTNFTIRVNPVTSKESPFTVRITCWRGLAETVADKIRKDDEVTVEGRLQVHQFEGNGGITKRTYEIDASNVYLGQLQPLGPAFEGQGAGGARPQQQQQYNSGNQEPAYSQPAESRQPVTAGVTTAKESFSPEDSLTEDDIPF
jgi:single-strand DNA-binding protein